MEEQQNFKSENSGSSPEGTSISAIERIEIASMLLRTHEEDRPDVLLPWVELAIEQLQYAHALLKEEIDE